MPLRPPAGFISAFFDPLKNPNAPTIGTATAGDTIATVPFTAPTNVGGSAISAYSALSTPGGIIASAASSPISFTGLTNGTAYTFRVWALNTYGPSAYSAASNSVSPAALQRGVSAGGINSTGGGPVTTMSYVEIPTLGNSVSFGDMGVQQKWMAGFGSTTRGVFGSGFTSGANGNGLINYITFATTGSATFFGNTIDLGYLVPGCSSQTRGIFWGSYTSVMSYVTIATTGNATTFGNNINNAAVQASACASPTRGLMAGGNASGRVNVIQYITIATTGNATDFGDLSDVNSLAGAVASSTRAVFVGGGPTNKSTTIQYVTIATTGNSTSFGTLSVSSGDFSSYSSETRGVVVGGDGYGNAIQYITIASTGNPASFGSIGSTGFGYLSAVGFSSCSGGVQ